MVWSYFSLTMAIALGVAGQVSLKEGASRSIDESAVLTLLSNMYVFLGLAAYFVAALFYLYAIRQIPLSVAFPSSAISYVVVSFFAHLIWGESFGRVQLLALVLICGGVYLMGREA